MRSFFWVLPDPPTNEMKDRFRKNGKNVEEEEEEEEEKKVRIFFREKNYPHVILIFFIM